MKTAACILGSALFREGFEVQDAPRYGAERRGAPIFAYVRAARAPINERGVIARPDLVVVADETLFPVATAGVLQGLDEHAVLLVRSAADTVQWRSRLGVAGPIVGLPLQDEPVDAEERPLIGAACAGAAARLVGVVGRHALEAAVRDEIGARSEDTSERTLARALEAFDALRTSAGLAAERNPEPVAPSGPAPWVDVPLDPVEVSAPDIHATATSERSPTGLWRTRRPVIDYDRCNRCTWVCGTFCPDGAIRVDPDRTPRIDYDHCKGCLVCAAVCPPHAIRVVAERARP